MGTRADFYIGRGETAEWIGSVAWDGHADNFTEAAAVATESAFREWADTELSKREDWTKPEDGWPWPWNNSQTTDYAYAFDGGTVYVSSFGSSWQRLDAVDEDAWSKNKEAVFPDMTSRQSVTYGRRSGVITIKF